MSTNPVYTLGQIAQLIGAELQGDAELKITGIQTLVKAGATEIGFLANPRYRSQLKHTQAAAVIIHASHLADCPVNALLVDDPYLAYAHLSHYFSPANTSLGIHQSAIVDPSAELAANVSIGPFVVIGADTKLAEGVSIGAHTVLGDQCSIGADSVLAANVTVYRGVQIGKRALIHSAAVIGSDGFGFAPAEGQWHKIAQLGTVVIGDDVEVGAGTTIDRGALDDTVIGNGVKLDNQIQIAHNVQLGDACAFAGCVGVAGSSRIGQRCTLGGGVVVAGHLDIADDVHVTAMGLVTKSIAEAGVYSSGTGMQPNQQWKRNVVRFRQLDQIASRLSELEKQVAQNKKDSNQ